MIPDCKVPEGIALLCDSKGVVQQILGDQLGVADCFPVGRSFTVGLAPDSSAKGLRFLQDILANLTVFGRVLQMTFACAGASTLIFNGSTVDKQILILAYRSTLEQAALLYELLEVQEKEIQFILRAIQEMRLKGPRASQLAQECEIFSALKERLANALCKLVTCNLQLERSIELHATQRLKFQETGDALASALASLNKNKQFISPASDESAPRSVDDQPERASSLNQLTKREEEVLKRITAGRTTKEVAADLGSSPRTIEVHRAQIMRKVGANSLAQLVRFALQNGLVDVPQLRGDPGEPLKPVDTQTT